MNGTIHILRTGREPGADVERYAVTYAPYVGKGGALPPRVCRGDDELVRFLVEIGIDRSTINETLTELHRKRRASIPNVVLSDEQVNRYGLKEMGIIESIISYLST